MCNDDFYTFSEYMKRDEDPITASMEDYIEMIYRLSNGAGYTRINDISKSLNVQPSSVTKMVQRLSELNLVNYEKYGMIILSKEGSEKGKYLLQRHNTIEEFLKLLGTSCNVLEETEKIEHTISDDTVKCFVDMIEYMKKNPEVLRDFQEFRDKDKK